jgi:CheY-like chemotaxis protein
MPGELQGLRVLVVEDEFLVAMDIELMLQQCGCAVVGPIADLATALRTVQEGGFDLALLDVNVGGQPVTAVADALAARAVPYVFCTGYQIEKLPGLDPMAPRLIKPFQLDDLRAVLLRATAPASGPAAPSAASPASGRGRRAGRRRAG